MTTRIRAVINRNHGRYHRIAKELTEKAQKRGLPAVNVYWVFNYIKHGEEPKSAELRKAMYLPPLPKHTKASQSKPDPPHHLYWWRRLPKDVREGIIRHAWVNLNSLTAETLQDKDK